MPNHTLKNDENACQLILENRNNCYIKLIPVFSENKPIDYTIIDFDNHFKKLVNKPESEIKNKNITSVFPSINKLAPKWLELSIDILSKNALKNVTLNIANSNNSYNLSIHPTKKSHIDVIINIFPKAEKNINRFEKPSTFYNTLFKTMPNPMYYIDTKEIFIECNNKFCKTIIGKPKKEIIGRSTLQLLKELNFDRSKYQNNNINGTVFQEKIRISNLQKNRIFILNESIHYDKNNEIKGFIGILVDITNIQIQKYKQQQNEIHIEEAQNEISNILESIDSIIIGVNTHDYISHWNSKAEDILGISHKEAIGKRVTELKLSWDWSEIYIGISKCMLENRKIYLQDISFQNSNNKPGMLGISINPIKDRNNNIQGFLIHGNDITEKRLLENQFFQDQKLKSIGELAAGIAHEINTPTQYVNNNTHFILDSVYQIFPLLKNIRKCLFDKNTDKNNLIDEIKIQFKEIDFEYISTEIPDALNQSIEGLNRISEIVNSMKSFSHPEAAKFCLCNLNKLLHDSITLSKNEWKYHSDIFEDYNNNIPEIEGIPAILNQTFLNIIVNAAHAIEEAINKSLIDKGILKIKTKQNEKDAIIYISDNGVGINDNIKGKIFDPFFTTKEVGKGTGQGLYLAYSAIVNKHNGTISIKSKENKGTTFIISIPLTQKRKK